VNALSLHVVIFSPSEYLPTLLISSDYFLQGKNDLPDDAADEATDDAVSVALGEGGED
jgi:hypothetical protein